MRPTWSDDNRGYQGGSWLPFNWYSIPVTRFLLFASVAVFAAYFFLGQGSGPVADWIPFWVRGRGDVTWVIQAWRWITYPFLEIPSLWYLVTLYLLYSYGGMLERAWGSVNFAVLFFAFAAVGVLAVGAGAMLLDRSVAIMGLGIPLTGLVTAWAALDPELECCFWGVTVKAKFIAAVWVIGLFVQFGLAYGPPLAVFSLATPLFAFLYVRKMPRLNLPAGRPHGRWAPDLRDASPRPRRPVDEREKVGGFNPLRRRREQAEIERLRKLLGEDDDRPMTRH